MSDVFCSPLLRAAIIVSDLDRSVRFYRDLFAFTEIYSHGDAQSDLVAGLLGRPPGTHTKYIILKHPGPSFGKIGLFTLNDPVAPTLEKKSPSVSISEIVLVFYHNRLKWLIENLASYGGSLLHEPVEIVIPGHSYQEAMIADPDGIKIAVMDRDPQLAYRTEGPGRTLS